VRVAAKAFDFEIEIPGVERVSERREWLGRSLKAEHTLVPGLAGEPISLLAGFMRAFRRGTDRSSIDGLSRLGAHRAIKPQSEAAGK
jgi:hypothetical protein